MFPYISLFGDDAIIIRDNNFQILLLAAFLPALGTPLLSPILDSLIDPFATTPENIGLMISAITAPGIFIIPVAGVLADRYGRKLILVSAITLFGISGTAIALTTDFRVVLGLRLLQGIGLAGTVPIIITSIGDLYSEEREATGQGIRLMTTNLGAAVLPLMSGVLVLFAWQYPFLMYALAVPIAMSVYLWFDEPTSEPTSSKRVDLTSYSRRLLGLSLQRRVLAMIIARALMPIVWIGFLTYNSLIVVRLIDGTPFEAGVLSVFLFVASALSASQAGRIMSFFQSRFYLLVSANIGVTVGFASVLIASNIIGAAISVLILGFGLGILASQYRSIITGFAPTDLRAGLVSISEAGGRLMATLTPISVGVFLALVSPILGFSTALQFAGFGLAIVGGVGGIVSLHLARASPPISFE